MFAPGVGATPIVAARDHHCVPRRRHLQPAQQLAARPLALARIVDMVDP
jgi:hypothetical protein